MKGQIFYFFVCLFFYPEFIIHHSSFAFTCPSDHGDKKEGRKFFFFFS
jgi:hypothetical protein